MKREFNKQELIIEAQICNIDFTIKKLKEMKTAWLDMTSDRHKAVEQLYDFCRRHNIKTNIATMLMEYEYYLKGERNLSATGLKIIGACKEELMIIRNGWNDDGVKDE